jgi:light-regulated signal transduction histidine kinase (bacteriophytochrome)
MGQRGTIHGRRKNGEEFPAEASISKLQIDGRWTYSVVLRDVTDQARREETMARQTVELERSNRELEAFASVASHDLQEPLRKIRAFGDRLRAGIAEDLDDENRTHLDRMLSAAARMSELIGDLLSFARVTTRGHPFELVNLNEVIREVVGDLEVALNESGGSIEVGALPAIEADPTQMRLLMQNLIGNALKYRRENVPPMVKVTGTFHPGPRPALVIEVQDNGIGFDEKYRERIFEVFQRLHGRGQYDGTGMGLAICKRIVERHGGAISARATPGIGATFLVNLPATARSGA